MRANLVAMLDGIGLHAALSLATTDEIFHGAHHLAAHLSAISYPVLVDNKNFNGGHIATSPVLSSLVRQLLGGSLSIVNEALVVPLGVAAERALRLLIDPGDLDPCRCLFGFPHPSGLNGHRVAPYEGIRASLRTAVTFWAATTNPTSRR